MLLNGAKFDDEHIDEELDYADKLKAEAAAMEPGPDAFIKELTAMVIEQTYKDMTDPYFRLYYEWT